MLANKVQSTLVKNILHSASHVKQLARRHIQTELPKRSLKPLEQKIYPLNQFDDGFVFRSSSNADPSTEQQRGPLIVLTFHCANYQLYSYDKASVGVVLDGHANLSFFVYQESTADVSTNKPRPPHGTVVLAEAARTTKQSTSQQIQIEQLYKEYDKALNRISRQECELLEQRSTAMGNADTIGQLGQKQLELDRCMLASRENQQLRKDKQSLTEELAAMRVKLDKLQNSRSQGIEEVKDFFMQEVRSLELENGELKQRSDEVQQRSRQLQLEMEEKEREIERLERQNSSLRTCSERTLKEQKLRYGRLQEVLYSREQQLQKATEVTRKMQEQASQLNYFVELQKEKSEELQLHYTSTLQHLKKQNAQLEKQISRLKEDSERIRQEQSTYREKINEAQAHKNRLADELRQQQEKLLSIGQLHTLERNQLERKLAAGRLEWQQQLDSAERSRSLLQGKYDKLRQRCQALLGREAAKRELQLHSYDQIDRLQELLRM